MMAAALFRLTARLPIEVKGMAEPGDKAATWTSWNPQARKQYASRYVKLQTKQFESLASSAISKSVFDAEARIRKRHLEIFAELVGNGLVYKQLKLSTGRSAAKPPSLMPNWNKDISSSSIYVNFPAASIHRQHELGPVTGSGKPCLDLDHHAGTLAANLAIAVIRA